uniref:DUF676 domain-containing protein n=1 Tax=Lotharella globosa TaxID=91324 RepID=A0A7S3Y7Z1_9EUKA
MCGFRLFREIVALHQSHPQATKLSIIGYSAGGLIARQAIALLDQGGYFGEGKLTPLNFVTVASPHCGIRRNPKLLSGRILNQLLGPLSGFMAGDTGRELALMDGGL